MVGSVLAMKVAFEVAVLVGLVLVIAVVTLLLDLSGAHRRMNLLEGELGRLRDMLATRHRLH